MMRPWRRFVSLRSLNGRGGVTAARRLNARGNFGSASSSPARNTTVTHTL